MIYRTGKPYTKDEVKEILNDRNSGMDWNTMCSKYQRTGPALQTLYSQYKLFLERGKIPGGVLLAIFKELNLENGRDSIETENSKQAVEQEQADTSMTILEEMDTAFGIFQNTLITLIDKLVEERTKEVVADREKELERVINEYEKEKVKVDAILKKMRESSFAGRIMSRIAR